MPLEQYRAPMTAEQIKAQRDKERRRRRKEKERSAIGRPRPFKTYTHNGLEFLLVGEDTGVLLADEALEIVVQQKFGDTRIWMMACAVSTGDGGYLEYDNIIPVLAEVLDMNPNYYYDDAAFMDTRFYFMHPSWEEGSSLQGDVSNPLLVSIARYALNYCVPSKDRGLESYIVPVWAPVCRRCDKMHKINDPCPEKEWDMEWEQSTAVELVLSHTSEPPWTRPGGWEVIDERWY